MPDTHQDVTGKRILILCKHATIGQAVKLNLEYLLHLKVQQCTFNRESYQHCPADLHEFEPDLLLIAEPTDTCNVKNLFRQIPWLQRYKSLPVLVLSEQPETQAFEDQNIHYLQFPYEQDELHNKLATILGVKGVAPTGQNGETLHLQTTVLIVEDEWIVAADLQSILEHQGYCVRGVASSSEDAFVIALDKRPDVILMDIRLQGRLDGIEIAERIQADLDIPVVFVIAFADKATLEKVKIAHTFGYVLKPFDEREVHTAVEIALYKHQVEVELQQRTQELRERNAELDAFAWAIAHEIRDPVNITGDFAEMLMSHNPSLPEIEMRHSLEMISELTTRVRRTVDNLLLLASIRDATLTLEPINMAEILERAIKRLETIKRKYNADIVQVGPWPEVLGQSTWVEEIWVNILSTAIRFGGSPPQLTIGATEKEDAIHFWVRDNGPGIKEEDKKRLFSLLPSSKIQNRYNQSLGLTVVTHIASRMGSRLSVQSNPNQGTTFAFSLPNRR
jgi:two-component system sensor histidine kinase/response regulator